MKPFLFRSVACLGISLLLSFGLEVSAQENAPDARDFREVITDAVTPSNQVQDQLDDLSADGNGFYLSVYDEVKSKAFEQSEQRFRKQLGINIDLQLEAPSVSGPGIFTDLYSLGEARRTVEPRLEDSLAANCVRFRAGQVDDELRRRQLLKQRLKEQELALQNPATVLKGDPSEELLLRLADELDENYQKRLEELVAALPEMEELNQQQQLLNCYEQLSQKVNFELRLADVFAPLERQLESLQVFMNGELESYEGLPLFDLVFDVEVMDYLLFGEGLDTGVVAQGAQSEEERRSGTGAGQTVASQILGVQDLLVLFEDRDGQRSLAGPSQGSSGTSSGNVGSSSGLGEEALTGPGFALGSSEFSGPLCIETSNGVALDFSQVGTFGQDEEEEEGAADDSSSEIVQERSSSSPDSGATGNTSASGSGDSGSDATLNQLGRSSTGALAEGATQNGQNIQQLCEGNLGTELGGEFFKLIFCLQVRFDKVGKTWTKVRDDCISCHIAKMNEVFEELVLSKSVRPRKNTGTIMESAICEDGFGDDISFHPFIEWVPVKFYPDLCYPNGGVSEGRFAELNGYPELLARVNKPGFFLDCEADFANDADAQERCTEVLNGQSTLSYDQFVAAYLQGIDAKITDLDAVDKDQNVWARLAGDHGIAQRELDFYQYRLGNTEALYPEMKDFEQDLKQERQEFEAQFARLSQPASGQSEAARVRQLLCLKGYVFSANNQECAQEASAASFENKVLEERSRVMAVLAQWNEQSQDFNSQQSCGMFEGSGPVAAFWEEFEDRLTNGDYYLDTDFRRTQSAQEKVAGQIISNTDLQDFTALFQAIDEEVRFQGDDSQERVLERSEDDQQKALLLQQALGRELLSFRDYLQSMSTWWSEMVDKDQFLSKGGEGINVLESFLEISY